MTAFHLKNKQTATLNKSFQNRGESKFVGQKET